MYTPRRKIVNEYIEYEWINGNSYNIRFGSIEIVGVSISNINNDYKTLLEIEIRLGYLLSLTKNSNINPNVRLRYNEQECTMLIKKVANTIRLMKLKEIFEK